MSISETNSYRHKEWWMVFLINSANIFQESFVYFSPEKNVHVLSSISTRAFNRISIIGISKAKNVHCNEISKNWQSLKPGKQPGTVGQFKVKGNAGVMIETQKLVLRHTSLIHNIIGDLYFTEYEKYIFILEVKKTVNNVLFLCFQGFFTTPEIQLCAMS